MVLEVLGEKQAAVLLGLAGFGAVVVGQVEVGDAVVEGGEDQGLHLVKRRDVAEIVPEAERYRRQLEAGGAGAVIGHRVITMRVGGVDGGWLEH